VSRPIRALLALLLAASPAAAASFPPHLRFRSLSTSEVTVHYHQGLEPMARTAAALAGEVLRDLEARYGVPVPPVHLVIADTSDDPNGFATPLPYPLVHIRAVPADGSDDFGNHDGWLRLVLTHELTHVVHLEQARGVIGLGRKLLGRAPYLFPNGFAPPWLIEGLATYEETERSAFGRGRNPDVHMLRRTAGAAGEFPKEDQAALGLDDWPGGVSAYYYGEGFVRELETSLGDGTLAEIARVHSGRIIPYTDDWTAHTVTGASFHTRWRDWREAESQRARRETDALAARGLSPSAPVTSAGVRQGGPRFSPDGALIAYTSRTLDRYRSLRVVRPDGSGDREVATRNSGARCAWTPDGRALVFDEAEVYESFALFSDLRVADVASGRVRKLTHGQRAREPDVAPDGRSVVFVRERGGHAELALVGMDGEGLRELTASAPGTEWSGPRFSPDGATIVAARWSQGGLLDLVRVDAASGAVEELTHDRAKDVEPAFSPDGRFVVFRSDRDGVSNLYALRLEDRALLRLTNAAGGAFTPDVAPDGRRVAFSAYSERGYDVHVMDVDWAALAPAAPFADPYPASRSDPWPEAAPDREYSPLPTLWPRFWSPYVTFSDEDKYGVVTAGADPLFRHAWGLDVHRGSETGRVGVRGYYQYDRFLPTLVASWEDTSDPAAGGGLLRTRELNLRARVPLFRRVRHSQSLSLGYRRSWEDLTDSPDARSLDLGAIEASWWFSNAHTFPYSVSPVEGFRLRASFVREASALGSDVPLSKLTGDARFYTRVFGRSDALALSVGGGTTFGRESFQDSYAVGGFPDASLLDLVRTNPAVLRGYPDNAFRGRHYAAGNAEYRVPLAHPQRGFRSFPIFLRHLHAAAFLDMAAAWSGDLAGDDVKAGAGVVLGGDFVLGHRLPLSLTLGYGHGFDQGGEDRVYFRTGLSF
jgi:Tol biopolymer transport system component